MSWWLLLIELTIVWFLWVVAAAAQLAVKDAHCGGPRNQRRGVSAAPAIPIFPLVFWSTALIVDLAFAPWGTLVIGWLHAALGVVFLVSITRNVWSLRSMGERT